MLLRRADFPRVVDCDTPEAELVSEGEREHACISTGKVLEYSSLAVTPLAPNLGYCAINMEEYLDELVYMSFVVKKNCVFLSRPSDIECNQLTVVSCASTL